MKVEGGYVEIHTHPETLESIRDALNRHEVETPSAEISMMPKSTVSLGDKEAAQTLRLLDDLEELSDVQRVYSNADFPDEALEKYRDEG